MKNKLLLCACAVAMLSALFSSCQKQEDLFAIDSQIAQKNLEGIYVFVDVDSVAMSTTLHEWKLANDSDGRWGYYRMAATGNGKDADVTTNLTWSEAIMAPDYLSMTIPVSLNGVAKNLKWSDGVVQTDGYSTTKFLISEATVLRKLHASFKNLTFEVNDTTLAKFLEKNMFKYLSWNTEQRKDVPVDTVVAYNAYLKTMSDTIAWFNARFDKDIPDTVRCGKLNVSGNYQVAIFPVGKEVKEVVTDTIIYGPAQIINGKMVYNIEDGVYKGSYSLRIQNWSLDYYMDPTESTATWSDSTYTIVDAIWTPSWYINGAAFSVLFKGHETIKMQSSEAGVVKKDYTKDNPAAFHTVDLKEFDTTEDPATIKVGDVQYKQVK